MILICIYKLLYIATQSCMNKNGTHTQVLFKDHTSSDVVGQGHNRGIKFYILIYRENL